MRCPVHHSPSFLQDHADHSCFRRPEKMEVNSPKAGLEGPVVLRSPAILKGGMVRPPIYPQTNQTQLALPHRAWGCGCGPVGCCGFLENFSWLCPKPLVHCTTSPPRASALTCSLSSPGDPGRPWTPVSPGKMGEQGKRGPKAPNTGIHKSSSISQLITFTELLLSPQPPFPTYPHSHS